MALELRGEGGKLVDRKDGLGNGLLKLTVNGRETDFLARDIGEDGSTEFVFRTWAEPSTSRVHVFRVSRETRKLEEISSIASRYQGSVELLDEGRRLRVPRLPRPHELRYGPEGYKER